jgi:endonuclease/exonuclease/phosphatase family metal-dependent hydrolase
MKLLKIFTVNARLDVDKGANDFELRKHRMAELINTEKPDIIGFQEATGRIRAELAKMLDGYYVLGCGREKNYGGESAAIAYRIDKFELIKLDTFWLSATPDIAGSRYGEDQSKCPRVTTAALLVLKEGGKPFWFINTHLDHIGSTARLLGATQIMQYISSKREPCILTGDFNAGPTSKEIRSFSANEHLGLVDCTANIEGTFHDYGRMEKMSKIDYIFTNMSCDVSKSFAFSDDAPNGTYYSDHLPVCAYIEVDD